MATPANTASALAAQFVRYPNLAWAIKRHSFTTDRNPAAFIAQMGDTSTEEAKKIHSEFELFLDAIESGIAYLYNAENEKEEARQELDKYKALAAKYEEHNMILTSEITRLSQANTTLIQTTMAAPTTTTNPTKKKTFEDPQKFSGEQSNMSNRQRAFQRWELQVESAFARAETTGYFANEIDAILYITDFLTGKAYENIRTDIKNIIQHRNEPALWTWKTAAQLMKHLHERYVILDPTQEAKRKLSNFPQGNKDPFSWKAELDDLMSQAQLTSEQKVDNLFRWSNAKMQDKFSTMIPTPPLDDYPLGCQSVTFFGSTF